MAGIVPKMSVRFSSFETYKGWLGADGRSKGKRRTGAKRPLGCARLLAVVVREGFALRVAITDSKCSSKRADGRVYVGNKIQARNRPLATA